MLYIIIFNYTNHFVFYCKIKLPQEELFKRHFEESNVTKIEIIFRRNNTFYNSTGWYGCVDKNSKIQPFSPGDKNWKYISVRCK